MENKRAQIGDTMAWIVATLIVFFIMFVFIAWVSLYAVKQKISFSENSISTSQVKSNSDLLMTQKLVDFLRIPVGNRETIKDLVVKSDSSDGKEERINLFKTEAKKFIDENMIVNNYNSLRVWIRVYDANVPIDQNYPGDYEAKISLGCDLNIPGTVIAQIFVYPNKKIVLCENYE
jgi:hypothetical protein